jgi:hypothetical protein
MAKKTAPEEKNPGGRPSEFKAKYILQTVKLCRLGATEEEIIEPISSATTATFTA